MLNIYRLTEHYLSLTPTTSIMPQIIRAWSLYSSLLSATPSGLDQQLGSMVLRQATSSFVVVNMLTNLQIFPTNFRARGLNIAASGGSIGSIIASQVWPVGMERIGSKTYFIFMCVNLVSILVSRPSQIIKFEIGALLK